MSRRSRTTPDLTEQQVLFCHEYLKDLSARKAAIRAGYSEESAAQQAWALLRNEKVTELMQQLMDERRERVRIDADTVLMKILEIADVDLAEAYNDRGQLKPIHDIPEKVRRAIAGIKVFEEFEGSGENRFKIGEVRELKFWDKLKSLELLGRHLKLFTDKVEHSGKVTLEQLVEQSNRKDEE